MPHKYSKEVLDARRDRAIRRGYLQPRDGRTIPVPANLSTSEAKVVLESMDCHASHALISGNPSHWARESTAAASSKIAPADATAAFKLHSSANKAKHDIAKNAFKRASGPRSQWPSLSESRTKAWADIQDDDSPPSCSALRSSSHISPPPSSVSFKTSPPQCSANETIDLEEHMPTDSDRTASVQVEPLSNAHVKVVTDGRFSAGCSISNGQSFYFGKAHLADSLCGERNNSQMDKLLGDQVAMLRAENEKMYQEVAELRNENLRLFDSSASLQQELCGSRAQLQAAEAAMGVWASHATALEELLFELRRQCFLGMCLGVDSDQLSWHGAGGEPQFLGVYGHLHSGSGSECRIESNPCSSLCGQLQSGSGSELRIDDTSNLRLEILEKQLANLSSAHISTSSRIDKLTQLPLRIERLEESFERLEVANSSRLAAVEAKSQSFMEATHLDVQDALREHYQLTVSTIGDNIGDNMAQLFTRTTKANEELILQLHSCWKADLEQFVDRKGFQSVLVDIRRDFDSLKDGLSGAVSKVESLCDAHVKAVADGRLSAGCNSGKSADFVALQEEVGDIRREFDILKLGLSGAVSKVEMLSDAHVKAVADGRLSAGCSTGKAAETGGPVAHNHMSGFSGDSSSASRTVLHGQAESPEITVGLPVVTHSLQKLEFNGLRGIVTAYNKKKCRFAVAHTDSKGKTSEMLFKPCNLAASVDPADYDGAKSFEDEAAVEQVGSARFKSLQDLENRIEQYDGDDASMLAFCALLDMYKYEASMLEHGQQNPYEDEVQTARSRVLQSNEFSRICAPSAVWDRAGKFQAIVTSSHGRAGDSDSSR